MSKTVETIADLNQHDISQLPSELQHESIRLFRDMCIGPMKAGAYQIVFNQSWMPYDYDIPEGWVMEYARTEFHPKRDNWILDAVLPSHACLTIVVSEQGEEDFVDHMKIGGGP